MAEQDHDPSGPDDEVLCFECSGRGPVARATHSVASFIREEGGRLTPPALVCSPGENDYATVNGMIMPRAKCGAPLSKSGMKQMAK